MIQIIGAVLTILSVLVVLRLVLQRRLLVKYAALWIAVTCALTALALIPGLLEGLARLLGFEVPSNLLFFAATALLLAISLHMSVAISRAERRIERLAEEVALLTAKSDEPPGNSG